MLYAMVFGHTPFDLKYLPLSPEEEQALAMLQLGSGAQARQLTVQQRVSWRIQRGRWRLPDSQKAGITVSRELVALIGRLLAVDPAQRPSASQVLADA